MWPYPKMIAHRGAGLLAPENTLAALRLAVHYGYQMVEYDVRVTADNQPVLLHDDTLDRTSSGSGPAADYSLRELAMLDFGRWHSPQYAGEAIATLDAVAAFTHANGLYSNIELKPGPGLEASTGFDVARVADTLWAGQTHKPLLSSFSEEALRAARQAAPGLARALLISGPLSENWETRLSELGCTALSMRHDYITEEVARQVKSTGYRLGAYTVNRLDRAVQLLSWNCDMIFTDAIDTIPATLTAGEKRFT